MKKPLGLIFSTQLSPIFLHLYSKYYYSFWNSVSMFFETRFAMLYMYANTQAHKIYPSYWTKAWDHVRDSKPGDNI